MTPTVKTVPWPEVTVLHERLAADRGRALDPLKELVQFIASSKYSSGMFASLSDETLCIGKTENFTPGKDELRISFDQETQTFTFVHAQRPNEKFPWSLSCPAAEWQSTFERIVHKRLRWFHEG